MIRNYITVIWRNLLRNKLFSFIHILGLTMGLACALFLIIIVKYEYSFDKFHENIERTYLLQITLFMESSDFTSDMTGDAYATVLQQTFPTIEATTRFRNPGELLLNMTTSEGKQQAFLENGGATVDSNFLKIFTFPLLQGNPETALNNSRSILLTKSTAEKFFGSTNVIGKEVLVNDEFNFMVTGILEDVPLASTLQFDWLIPYNFLTELEIELCHFEGSRTYNFALIHDDADVDEINHLLPEQILKWYEPDIQTLPFFTKFSRIHLHGQTKNFEAIRVFIIVAILILLLACINYMNLSTARFTGRAKEVGVRKTFGADRGKLFWQFIGESVFMAFIALDLALLILEAVLPFVSLRYEVEILIPYSDPQFIGICLGLITLTGFTSGSYPAIILSSFSPIKVLKNPAFHGFRGFKLRKLLVVFQFVIAVIFILCSIFIYEQLKHVKTADRGFREEGMLHFATKGELWDNYPMFRNEVLGLPGVENITTAHSIPSFISLGEFEWGLTDESQKTIAHVCWAGLNFPETFDIKMLEGEFYNRTGDEGNDGKIVINKKLVDFLELENPVGSPFYLYHDRYKIIGVIDDFEFFPFNMSSLALIIPYQEVSNNIFVALGEDNREGTITEIEKIYKKYNPSYPFDYYFQDEYKLPFEEGMENIIPLLWMITLLGISISLLGLFGLASYTTSQKTVEIGVRKAFGADSGVIVKKLVIQFAKPVILGITLGIAFAYFITMWMFSLFVNPVIMSFWVFVIVGTGVLCLSLLTVLWQSVKAANRNPLESLRYE